MVLCYMYNGHLISVWRGICFLSFWGSLLFGLIGQIPALVKRMGAFDEYCLLATYSSCILAWDMSLDGWEDSYLSIPDYDRFYIIWKLRTMVVYVVWQICPPYTLGYPLWHLNFFSRLFLLLATSF